MALSRCDEKDPAKKFTTSKKQPKPNLWNYIKVVECVLYKMVCWFMKLYAWWSFLSLYSCVLFSIPFFCFDELIIIIIYLCDGFILGFFFLFFSFFIVRINQFNMYYTKWIVAPCYRFCFFFYSLIIWFDRLCCVCVAI